MLTGYKEVHDESLKLKWESSTSHTLIGNETAFNIEVFVDADQTPTIETQLVRQESSVDLKQTLAATHPHETVVVELILPTLFLIVAAVADQFTQKVSKE